MNIDLLVSAVVILSGILFMLLQSVTLRKSKRLVDYYAFFTVGLGWFIAGVILNNHILYLSGAVSLAVSFMNKNKWDLDPKKWRKLDSKEIKLFFIIAVITFFIFITGVIVYYISINKLL